MKNFSQAVIYLYISSISILTFFYPSSLYAQTAGGGGTDALQMLVNLSKTYPALWKMITGLSYLIGFSLAMRSIYHLKIYGELRTMMSTQTSLKTPVTLMLVAVVLMFIPTAFKMLNLTAFGYGSPLSYEDVSSTMNPVMLKAVAGIVQLVGLIAFIRGWMHLVGHVQQSGGQHTLGKALTHIIGGLLAINIIGVTDIFWNTFGFSSPFTV